MEKFGLRCLAILGTEDAYSASHPAALKALTSAGVRILDVPSASLCVGTPLGSNLGLTESLAHVLAKAMPTLATRRLGSVLVSPGNTALAQRFIDEELPLVTFHPEYGALCSPSIPPRSVPSHLHLPGESLTSLAAAIVGIGERSLDPGYHAFGPHPISTTQVFLETEHSLALVNLKPVVNGHVLVIPRRRVPRFGQLDAEEVCDLWLTVQRVSGALETFHGAHACSIALQDGPAAGQTVPHVHAHVLPRHTNDLEDNDEIYSLIEESGPGEPPREASSLRQQILQGRGSALAVDPQGVGSQSSDPASTALASSDGHGSLPGAGGHSSPIEAAIVRGRPLQIPVSRHPRSLAAMAAEAAVYRKLFS